MTTANTASAATTLRRRTGPSVLARLLRSRMAGPSLVIVVAVILCAVFANVLSPYDPYRQDYNAVLEPPSRAHLMGTDDIGRDVLSRIIYGSRVSASVGLVAVGIAMIIGIPLGLIAAYRGSWLDDVIMRIMDALSAFPPLILALGITAALKPGLLNVMVAIGVVSIPQFARLVRSQALTVREMDFVTAARMLGASPLRLIGRHIWPNSTSPIIVQASLRVAVAIVTEATLSFLGAGVPLPTPSWGSMLRSSYQYTETAPYLVIFPGAAIFVTVLATNLLGDALRSALDPRMRGRG